jgi:DNA invertase Pin-like site-specific DNA recombinase
MPRGRKITADQSIEIRNLANSGLTVREISDRVKLHYSAVAKLLREAGIRPDIGAAVTEKFGQDQEFDQHETLVFTWAQKDVT